MRTRGGRVSDRSGVYKITMMRMYHKVLTNLRMYGSKVDMYRNILTSSDV